MQKNNIQSKIPFLFLLAISIYWAFYYQSNGPLNDYGRANFEWLFLIDGLISLPILCFLCIRDKKQALLKSIILACVAIFIGGFIIPQNNQIILHDLENGRYLLLAIVLLVELTAIATVYLSVHAAISKRTDPDLGVEKAISSIFGTGNFAKLLSFETRMWTYALFAARITPESFLGQKHFSYHGKDGGKSNLLGFVILIALEIPIMHMLLHYMWSPLAANIFTILSLFTLVFFFAEYRAVSRRPISLMDDRLIVRFGLYPAFSIALSNIGEVRCHREFVRRSRQAKRFNYAGAPNIAIELIEPQGQIKMVYLGVDDPQSLLQSLKPKVAKSDPFRDKV